MQPGRRSNHRLPVGEFEVHPIQQRAAGVRCKCHAVFHLPDGKLRRRIVITCISAAQRQTEQHQRPLSGGPVSIERWEHRGGCRPRQRVDLEVVRRTGTSIRSRRTKRQVALRVDAGRSHQRARSDRTGLLMVTSWNPFGWLKLSAWKSLASTGLANASTATVVKSSLFIVSPLLALRIKALLQHTMVACKAYDYKPELLICYH